MADPDETGPIDKLLATPGLADALESDRFKHFLDHVPVAIAVSELHPSEVITYANIDFMRITGLSATDVKGATWRSLLGAAVASADTPPLSDAVELHDEYIGRFTIQREGETIVFDAWSNTIEDDEGVPMFRLVALANVANPDATDREKLSQVMREKDVLLQELQHRVKNNLQMITALIRMEARNVPDDETGERFDRLAGRIGALALLYDSLSASNMADGIDLGVYLSQIASAVMQAHATEGIRLDLQVDTWPVSVNVAMPAGLVVNELLTNSLKHAFGKEGGTIRLHSLVDETGCRVTISDDGVGLSNGVSWPKAGKLGAVIAQSLRQNAKAEMTVDSSPGEGVRVTIFFAKAGASPAVD